MSPNRREFLHRTALSAAALSASPALLHAVDPGALSPHPDPGMTLELTPEFTEYSGTAGEQRREWDLSWIAKITGKYRAVFDAPEFENGLGVYRAAMFTSQFREVTGADDKDISVVLVIRHNAMPLIMTHAFWDEYDLGASSGARHPTTGKPTRRNPALMDTETDNLPAVQAGYSLDKLMQRGVIVLACNQAFSRMTSLVSSKHGIRGSEARDVALKGVAPGVVFLPSGIVAVQLAQENGCRYQRAS